GIILHRRFQVALIDRGSTRDGLLHTCAFHLHAAPVHLLVFLEPGQQLALAAAQIQHPRLWLDQVSDDREVAPPIDVSHRCYALGQPPAAAPRNVLARNPRTTSVCCSTSTRNESCP